MEEQTTQPVAPVEDNSSQLIQQQQEMIESLKVELEKVNAKNSEVIGEKRRLAERQADPEALQYLLSLIHI